MKMRSILLSVLAIAVLASCAKDNGLGAGEDGDASEAKVTLRLKGNGSPSSRATGPVVSDDEQIHTLTVFFFNGSGGVIGDPYWLPAGAPTTNLATTTDARKVAVIANLATDQTGTGGLFDGVTNLTSLQSKLGDLLNGTTPTQQANAVYMSGIAGVGEFTLAEGATTQKATVTVMLNFISARIQIRAISWNGKDVTNNVYADKDDFATTTNADFTIEQIYLMNVQTKTQFLPNTITWSTASPPVATLGTDYIRKNERSFTGGVAWTAPWPGTAPTGFVQNGEYLLTTMPVVSGTGNSLENPGYWYVFTNNVVADVKDHPTALVVEAKWRSVAGSTDTKDILTRYFTVYFGSGDQEAITAGNDYQVTLRLNGSFKPATGGGDGGGGTDDPSVPSLNSVVDITVDVKPWDTITVDKEWE